MKKGTPHFLYTNKDKTKNDKANRRSGTGKT